MDLELKYMFIFRDFFKSFTQKQNNLKNTQQHVMCLQYM